MQPDPVTIERARADDLAAVLDLLTRCGLPVDGLADHVGTLVVARSGGLLIGSAALEVYGPDVLLRSVAVEAAWRGRGLGQALTESALALARELGAGRAYLLTETAASFFPRYGFRPIPRTDVPARVQQSVEFTSACPQSAATLVADLQA